MSFIVTFIAAVFVFSAVIAIHEFGHFMVAKLCGVQVNEFSIGMGPVLCKRVRKGTQYSIRALPVGGFVALEGEESPESKQAEERSNPSAAAAPLVGEPRQMLVNLPLLAGESRRMPESLTCLPYQGRWQSRQALTERLKASR